MSKTPKTREELIFEIKELAEEYANMSYLVSEENYNKDERFKALDNLVDFVLKEIESTIATKAEELKGVVKEFAFTRSELVTNGKNIGSRMIDVGKLLAEIEKLFKV